MASLRGLSLSLLPEGSNSHLIPRPMVFAQLRFCLEGEVEAAPLVRGWWMLVPYLVGLGPGRDGKMVKSRDRLETRQSLRLKWRSLNNSQYRKVILSH